MTRFVCPNCGSTIHFLSGEAICLNPTCKLGHTLTRNQPDQPKDTYEQPQTQINPDQHRPEQPPIGGDEADSGSR